MQGSTLRSPEVLTPSFKKRDAEEEDHEVSTHTSWGGRGKRGVAPSALAESVPSKRKRVQVKPSLVVACMHDLHGATTILI